MHGLGKKHGADGSVLPNRSVWAGGGRLSGLLCLMFLFGPVPGIAQELASGTLFETASQVMSIEPKDGLTTATFRTGQTTWRSMPPCRI